jgi:putative transposase
LQLYEKAVPASFFEEICQQQGYRFRQGVYTVGVVVWLMIYQRLHRNRTLAAAVQWLLQGHADNLLSRCKRVEQGTISARAAGYCQARQKLPTLVASQVTDRLVEQLRGEMQEGWPGLQRPVLLIDGTSLQLRHAAELVEAFPPGHNQHGENHWPVLRLVVFHDVYSGLCVRPSWGPMYGTKAVSEQALAEKALERLPADAVVLTDCNFGIFAFAWSVQQSGRSMISRLTEARARKILGDTLRIGTDRKVVWEASRWDRLAHPNLPEGASVTGRLIVCAHPSRPQELLYLFTTLELACEEIIAMYKLRWNVETDLRSLKRTVDLHQIHSQSVDLVEKEVLLAVSAYNLVRAVMCLAARRAQVAPRQLSFSFVQTAVEAALPALHSASSAAEYNRQLERLLDYAAQARLPQRSHRRSYPRQVWGRGGAFPRRHAKAKQ